jgi:hypothetical protein
MMDFAIYVRSDIKWKKSENFMELPEERKKFQQKKNIVL